MANKYTKQIIDMELTTQLYRSGFTQCKIAEILGTTQKVIWSRFKEIGFKCRVACKRNQERENNDSWRGDRAGYAAFHKRIESQRGKPTECEVCGTTEENKTYDWASLTSDYNNPDDYMRMCRSCHAKYDDKINNILNHTRGVVPHACR